MSASFLKKQGDASGWEASQLESPRGFGMVLIAEGRSGGVVVRMVSVALVDAER